MHNTHGVFSTTGYSPEYMDISFVDRIWRIYHDRVEIFEYGKYLVYHHYEPGSSWPQELSPVLDPNRSRQGKFYQFLSNATLDQDATEYAFAHLCHSSGMDRRSVLFFDRWRNKGGTGKSLLFRFVKVISSCVTVNGIDFEFGDERIDPFPKKHILAFEDANTSDTEKCHWDADEWDFRRLLMIQSPFCDLPPFFNEMKDQVICVDFSNHYNHSHHPKAEFGIDLIDEFTDEDWNDFFNVAARCIQEYLQRNLAE